MITVHDVKLFDNYQFMGLSTDEKPTEDVNVNSLFLELDTGDFYYLESVATPSTWSTLVEEQTIGGE